MLTLLGSLLGFGTSIIPSIFDFFKQKRDQEHEYKMVELQQRGVAAAAQQALDLANINADIREFEAAQKSQSVKTGTWVDGLSQSVRPVITYCFFILFCGVEGYTAWVLWQTDLSDLTKLGMIWNAETSTLFSTIICYWFGNRAYDKRIKAR